MVCHDSVSERSKCMRITHLIVAVIASSVIATASADHLRRSQQARGEPDLTLAGVSLNDFSLSKLNKRFGSPLRITDNDVYWIKSEVHIHAVRAVTVDFKDGETYSTTDPEQLSVLEIS